MRKGGWWSSWIQNNPRPRNKKTRSQMTIIANMIEVRLLPWLLIFPIRDGPHRPSGAKDGNFMHSHQRRALSGQRARCPLPPPSTSIHIPPQIQADHQAYFVVLRSIVEPRRALTATQIAWRWALLRTCFPSPRYVGTFFKANPSL